MPFQVEQAPLDRKGVLEITDDDGKSRSAGKRSRVLGDGWNN